jgi:tRNA uridine 5-carbamoylmethylation protein Kti12
MKVIGISGLARSGKDCFATIATKILTEKYKLKVDRHALAYELKDDLKDLVKKKTGIDIFTEKTEEKNIIRPLLVIFFAAQ